MIPKGAPNPKKPRNSSAFATDTQRLADQAKWISYGPARKSPAPLVGKFMDGKTDMGPHMPTAPENMTNALPSSYELWVDRDSRS